MLSQPARGDGAQKPQKRRAPAVSSDTENKLARAARSAQRLAQLSDAARDGTTLDLFPDDTARAEQQALNIDVRQGTLQGFELPDVVLAAVGAPDGVGFAPASTAARGARAAVAKADRHDGQLSIDTSLDGDDAVVTEPDAKPAVETPPHSALLTASSVARSSTALRPPADEPEIPVPPMASAAPAPEIAIAQAAPPQAQPPRATPELDHARATAFADTVDALYGVIADQRRASSEHSRRMKWLLSIVVCALLATIAIGIAQTLLLSRLARQSTAHEQRIEQMLLNQQATLATLLDTDSATVSLPVSTQAAAAPAPAPSVAPPATSHADTPSAHTRRAQSRKLAHTH
jgi:hypothetical protein